MLSFLTKNGMAAYIHPKRKCIFEEAKRLKSLSNYSHLKIQDQISEYIRSGMPNKYGLWAGGILVRNNSSNAKKICDLWWQEINKWTYRDQLSLPYVLWQNNLNIDTITLKQYSNQFFKIHQHLKRKY
jgi:hypothetical protein